MSIINTCTTLAMQAFRAHVGRAPVAVVGAGPQLRCFAARAGPSAGDKDAPGEARGGADTEVTGGDANSKDNISHSDAAFDSSSTRPDTEAKQVENETGNDMSRSAASKQPSKMASGQRQKKEAESGG